MSEDEIHWVGRRPAAVAAPTDAVEDAAFAAAMTRCAEQAGCAVERFVAAQGPFGSWLLEVRLDGGLHRLIWNGQSGCLSLDRVRPGGGWDELAADPLETPGVDAFAAALPRLVERGRRGADG